MSETQARAVPAVACWTSHPRSSLRTNQVNLAFRTAKTPSCVGTVRCPQARRGGKWSSVRSQRFSGTHHLSVSQAQAQTQPSPPTDSGQGEEDESSKSESSQRTLTLAGVKCEASLHSVAVVHPKTFAGNCGSRPQSPEATSSRWSFLFGPLGTSPLSPFVR